MSLKRSLVGIASCIVLGLVVWGAFGLLRREPNVTERPDDLRRKISRGEGPVPQVTAKRVHAVVAPPVEGMGGGGAHQPSTIPQEKVFTWSAAGLSKDTILELGLNEDQVETWKREMAKLRNDMTDAARSKSKSLGEDTDGVERFEIAPFPDEATRIKDAFISGISESIDPLKTVKLVERFNWGSYWGGFGANRVEVGFFEMEYGGGTWFMAKYQTYDPRTGEKRTGGQADYDTFVQHFGEIFNVSPGDSLTGRTMPSAGQ